MVLFAQIVIFTFALTGSALLVKDLTHGGAGLKNNIPEYRLGDCGGNGGFKCSSGEMCVQGACVSTTHYDDESFTECLKNNLCQIHHQATVFQDDGCRFKLGMAPSLCKADSDTLSQPMEMIGCSEAVRSSNPNRPFCSFNAVLNSPLMDPFTWSDDKSKDYAQDKYTYYGSTNDIMGEKRQQGSLSAILDSINQRLR